MQVVRTSQEMQTLRRGLSGTVGFVPTMGYLHAGHLTLAERARTENDQVIVSIFVNPAQFAPTEDLSRYPRDEARDLEQLSGAGVDYVFMPTVEDMYPTGFQTIIEVTGVTLGLEGERRPGHFRGVTTVVSKLFNLVTPTRAYFGQKDAQQATVIRRMIADLAFGVELVIVPIVRDSDGLALSSRNIYLTAAQRAAAPILSAALRMAAAEYKAGQRDPETLRQIMQDAIAREPLAVVDYVSVADASTLTELHQPITGSVLLSMAVLFGTTRLIDNMLLG